MKRYRFITLQCTFTTIGVFIGRSEALCSPPPEIFGSEFEEEKKEEGKGKKKGGKW